MDAAAIIPDLIDRHGHAGQPFPGCRILDTEAVREDHAADILVCGGKCKSYGTDGIAFQRYRCIWSLLPNIAAASSMQLGADWLAEHFARVCERMEAQLIASDGEDNHVHLLVEYPPRALDLCLGQRPQGHMSGFLRQADPTSPALLGRGFVVARALRGLGWRGTAFGVLKQYVENQATGLLPVLRGRDFRPGNAGMSLLTTWETGAAPTALPGRVIVRCRRSRSWRSDGTSSARCCARQR